MQPSSDLSRLIAEYRRGFALPAGFYCCEEVYRRDLELVFFRQWVFAGHVSRLPEVGCYFCFELGGESVIILRGRDDEIRAFANVCRHRGSRICDGDGKAATLVCPYHAWTYGLDGKLRSRRGMAADFVTDDYGLKSIRCGVFHGLIFINFCDDAPPLNDGLSALDSSFKIYDLANTKVAHREIFPVKANWKLAVENFMECYHCGPAHAEYAERHALQSVADNAKLRTQMRREAKAIGYETVTRSNVESPAWFGDEGKEKTASKTAAENLEKVNENNDLMHCYYARNALYKPFLTGSKNGEPLAPLLGEISAYGGGVADVQMGAVSYGLLYADHAVLYAFAPRGVQATDMEITWLVRADAVAGRDYDAAELTWLWRVTTEADKKIINDNQAGVNSRFYAPGPLADMEEFTGDFLDWYVARIS